MASQFTVKIGSHIQSATNEEFATTLAVNIKTSHPSYNPLTLSNDISLLRLVSPVTFIRHIIGAVCIPALSLDTTSEGAVQNVRLWASG